MGELEEQLEETKEDQQKREAGMRDRITRLEADVQRFNVELQSWKLRYETLDRVVKFERKAKDAALSELAYLRNGSGSVGTDAVPLPPRRDRNMTTASTQSGEKAQEGPAEDLAITCGRCTPTGPCACLEEAIAISTNGCGKCTPSTHCECLEATLETAADGSVPSKRSHSPSVEDVDKRPKISSDSSTPLEQDFTAQFSSKPVQTRTSTESCGFCDDGTYCICAETNNSTDKYANRLPPLLNEVTPPPSDSESEGQSKLTPMQPSMIHRAISSTSANSCINGPGTCQQCLKDPKSGLFCRSLAAVQASSGSSKPEGCCGGNASSGGCCKSPTDAAPQVPHLTCADTYKTLSTHKNFEQATDELNTWIGHLHAVPHNVPGRTPMEVEAASVIGVLKFFDRRFGRG